MTNNRPIKEPTDGELLHESLVRNHISQLCPPHDGHLDQAAAEFLRPYRERIAELEAENTRLREAAKPTTYRYNPQHDYMTNDDLDNGSPTSDHLHEIGSCSYRDKGDASHNERKP